MFNRNRILMAAEDANPGSGGSPVADANGNWVIELNLAGVEPASGKGFGGPRVKKSGVYVIDVKSSERFISSNGFDTVVFRGVVAEGEFAGCEQDVLLPGRPNQDEKDPTGQRFAARWKALLLNIAKDPANLEKGKFAFGTASKNNPTGKQAYVYITVYPEGEKDKNGYPKRPNANFMAPAEASAEIESEKALQARKIGQAPAGATATSTTQQPTAKAAPASNGTLATPPPATPQGADPLAEI